MIPDIINEKLKESAGLSVFSYRMAGGGCINSGGTIETDKGRFFIKWNSASRFPEMFEKEAHGLQLLFGTGAIRIPRVIHTGEAGNYAYILLENIDRGRMKTDYWALAGSRLAALHKNGSGQFGLDTDNYIGSLPQSNQHKKVWSTFFIENRLEPQLKLAVDSGKLGASDVSDFGILCEKLGDLLPDSKPSLIHGDLWSGNIMMDHHGEPCLIDPAVYYGNREIEIAYTMLFGGFDREFYSAYNNEYPLEPGFDSRVDLYNLYPLLVHVNLFGGSYVTSVRGNLRRYL